MVMAISNFVLLSTGLPAMPAHMGWEGSAGGQGKAQDIL